MIHIRLWSHVDVEPWDKARISLLYGSFYLQDSTHKGEEIKYKLETIPPGDQLGRGLWWVCTLKSESQNNTCFQVEHKPAGPAITAWLNTDSESRKDSRVCRNTDKLHSRAPTFTGAVKEKCPDKFWVEWQTPWGEVKALQIRSFSCAGTHSWTHSTLEGQSWSWEIQNPDTSKKKMSIFFGPHVWKVCVSSFPSPITPSVFPPESSGSFGSSPLVGPKPPGGCPWVTSSAPLLQSCSPVCSSCCAGETKHVQLRLKSRGQRVTFFCSNLNSLFWNMGVTIRVNL